MKFGKLKGLLVTAVIIMIVVAISWRVAAIRKVVFGTA
jgi:hypothetical protein